MRGAVVRGFAHDLWLAAAVLGCALGFELADGSVPAYAQGQGLPEVGAEGPPPVSPPAAAGPSTSSPPTLGRVFPALSSPSLSHQSQIGVSVSLGSGFRVLFPYAEGIYCGQPGKRACSGRLPTFIEVQPSYGITAHWDLLADVRFGLEADFARSHQLALAPGVRYWVDPAGRAKFFTTLQISYDVTAQHTSALSRRDVALRNTNGLMIEVMRDLGFYAQFGDTIGFVRWLRFEIDVGGGVQARFP